MSKPESNKDSWKFLGRPKHWLALGAAVLALTTLDRVYPHHKQIAANAITHYLGTEGQKAKTIEEAVERGLGKSILVRCTDLPGRDLGRTLVGSRNVLLDTRVCTSLAAFAEKPSFESSQQDPFLSRAALVVAHEVGHSDGISDEGIAECYGIQGAASVAVGLGASETTAAIIANEEAMTPHDRKHYETVGLAKYTPPEECVRGGEYDFDLQVGGLDFFPGDPPVEVEVVTATPSAA